MNRLPIVVRLVASATALVAVLALTAVATAPASAAVGANTLHFATPASRAPLPVLALSNRAGASRSGGGTVIGATDEGGLVLATGRTTAAWAPVAATQLDKAPQPIARQPASAESAWFWLAFGISVALVVAFILTIMALTRRPRLAV
jgi:hypothetical protein